MPEHQNLARHIGGLKSIRPSRHSAFLQMLSGECVASVVFATLERLVGADKFLGFYDSSAGNTDLKDHLKWQAWTLSVSIIFRTAQILEPVGFARYDKLTKNSQIKGQFVADLSIYLQYKLISTGFGVFLG